MPIDNSPELAAKYGVPDPRNIRILDPMTITLMGLAAVQPQIFGPLLIGSGKNICKNASKSGLRSVGAAAINIKFPNTKQLAKTLGTSVKNFHRNIKPGIIKDFSKEIKRIGARNPDIGITEAGHIAFRNPKTGKTFITDVMMEAYLP